MFKNFILDMIKQKIDEMGGVDTLKKAIVWKWWNEMQIKDERDFDSAIDECYRCYEKANELKQQWEVNDNENTTTFLS